MKARNILLSVLVASAVSVSTSELDEAYNAFVKDYIAEQGD